MFLKAFDCSEGVVRFKLANKFSLEIFLEILLLFPSTKQYMLKVHAIIYRPMSFIRHSSANCSQLLC